MGKFVGITLILLTQILIIFSTLDRIDNLLAQIDQVENDSVRFTNHKNQNIVVQLQRIKNNLIFNVRYHDGINSRELKNIVRCSNNAFQEQLETLKREFQYYPTLTDHDLYCDVFNQKSFLGSSEERSIQWNLALKTVSNILLQPPRLDLVSKDLASLNIVAFNLLDREMLNNEETPYKLGKLTVRALENLIRNSTNKMHHGEFLKGVDTLAHFVQTRLQHDKTHASELIQISITLIKEILTKKQLDFINCLRVTTNEVKKLANLAQKELEANYKSAHVELFIGGFSNLLLVTRNFAINSEESIVDKVPFILETVNHNIESILSGSIEVKQALAIEAINFQNYIKTLGYNPNFSFLQNLETFEKTQTAIIIQEFASSVRAVSNLANWEILSILQILSIRFQNIFRMSHENNLQVLFMHILLTMDCVEFKDVSNIVSYLGYQDEVSHQNIVNWIEKLVINGYKSEDSAVPFATLQKFLVDIQKLCITTRLGEENGADV